MFKDFKYSVFEEFYFYLRIPHSLYFQEIFYFPQVIYLLAVKSLRFFVFFLSPTMFGFLLTFFMFSIEICGMLKQPDSI